MKRVIRMILVICFGLLGFNVGNVLGSFVITGMSGLFLGVSGVGAAVSFLFMNLLGWAVAFLCMVLFGGIANGWFDSENWIVNRYLVLVFLATPTTTLKFAQYISQAGLQ